MNLSVPHGRRSKGHRFDPIVVGVVAEGKTNLGRLEQELSCRGWERLVKKLLDSSNSREDKGVFVDDRFSLELYDLACAEEGDARE